MRHVSRVLIGLAQAVGLDIDEIVAPIESRFRRAGGMPRRWRSSIGTRSVTGSMQTDGEQVDLPCALPYVAGFYTGGNVRLTGAQIAPDVVWYGSIHDAKVIGFRLDLPLTLVAAMRGRRLKEIVGHPAFAGGDEIVLDARHKDGHLTLSITNAMVPAPRRETAADRVEEMLAAA